MHTDKELREKTLELVDKMRERFLPVNIDGLEPALTNDICEIVEKHLSLQKQKIIEVIKKWKDDMNYPTLTGLVLENIIKEIQ